MEIKRLREAESETDRASAPHLREACGRLLPVSCKHMHT